MKILFVTQHDFWPITDGGRIRGSHILEGLARHNEVHVALAHHWKSVQENFLRNNPLNLPLHILEETKPPLWKLALGKIIGKIRPVLYYAHKDRHRRAFLKLVEELKPDLIWYFQQGPIWGTGTYEGIPCVLDMDNYETGRYVKTIKQLRGIRKLLSQIDYPIFERMEKGLLKNVSMAMLANPDDVLVLEKIVPVKHLPNGFDFPQERPKNDPELNTMMFVGWLHYEPNISGLEWFCGEVWPKIMEKIPDAKFRILGDCGRNKARVDILGQIPGVTLEGFVDDTKPYFEKSCLMVVPLLVGSGTRIKILESWSRGVPVVSTNVGCEGLGATDGENILIADGPDGFAQRCVQALTDMDFSSHLVQNAFQHGKSRFDWKVIYNELDEYINCISNDL